ncbi:Hint domain-containing protein [Anianabacter salinae]|uniref:Hint domain-containing protein n=1 Tax=Anianabacter salinae TaxID=2851023 RepID=UPI00225E1D7E|nr:Hint domain-containing protein [Anianabacter salinae]MBV0912613.1 Hint domain-containing protein [Anianabacter salinae]
MTYPHRPGDRGAATPLSTFAPQPWTVRKSTEYGTRALPMRRYEITALTPDGDYVDDILRGPAHPAFESAFAALARGTLLSTEHGPMAVEDLQPGIWIETRDNGLQMLVWRGAMTLIPRADDTTGRACLYRIPMDAFGPQRPMPDLVLGPYARLVTRNPALADLVGRDSALVPLPVFEDGHNVIRVTPASPVTVYHLAFARHQIISVNGLDIDSMHPGGELAGQLTDETLRLFLSLFPHAAQPGRFGPLALPRISEDAWHGVRAA